MKLKLFLLSFLLAAFIDTKCQYNVIKQSIKVSEQGRNYLVYYPKNYGSEKSYPLVFVLHGGGGSARGLIRSTRAQFNKLANRHHFVVVYPNGIGKSWNDGPRDTIARARKQNINDVEFFRKMIADFSTDKAIDTTNIFACGISNGGFMVQRLAYEMSHKIKAIAVVAANLSTVQWKQPPPKHPVSVLFINGTHDPLVPYRGGYVQVFNRKRGQVLSVKQSIKTWRTINNATILENKHRLADNDKNDGCQAFQTTWINNTNSKIKVSAVTVKNGGHTWPGSKQNLPKRLVGNTSNDFNGCNLIWNFFSSVM